MLKSSLAIRMTWCVLRIAGASLALMVLFLKPPFAWWILVCPFLLALGLTIFIFRNALKKTAPHAAHK
jgi:hypothetical protein